MQKIKLLSPLQAQKIAAGEVVERPANVVKELVENSLDAQATKISIHLEKGGHGLIRIVDNGCGMSEEDADLCFAHHATSKLTTINDLDFLSTFGFRGEALSSINSVSKITLQTKEKNADHGLKIEREQEKILNKENVSCAPGTAIAIHDIFYNVPARKKFLKKQETEWRAIVQLFQAFCLDYLSIHFQLYSDGKLTYNCPPTNSLSNRMSQLFDHTIGQNLIELEESSKNSIKVYGIISNHQVYRYNKNQIFFFVNKRWVKNYQLSRALMKGYLNVLPPERSPVAGIFIELDQNMVDINIHPRKEEVQFLNPRRVETLIFETVKIALEKELSKNLKTKEQKEVKSNTITPFFDNQSEKAISTPFSMSISTLESRKKDGLQTEPALDNLLDANSFKAEPQTNTTPIQQMETQSPITPQDSPSEKEYTILGVAHKTYIMLEHEDGIFFVDQHAAHERVLYELFAKRFQELATIQLIFPEIIEIIKDDLQLLLVHIEIFKKNGIEIEQIAENKIAIKSIPVHLKSVKWKDFFKEAIEDIHEIQNLPEEDFFNTIHKKLRAQMACKAAVKAGDDLSRTQIIQLLHDLDKTENRITCPHGRPTSWLLRQYEIEKKFKRKL